MAKSIEKLTKITKEDFIKSVVYKGYSDTNKDIAAKLGISEPYYYKLLKRYSKEIASALRIKKNSIRLKAISVLEYHLAKNDLRAALTVLKQIGWEYPPAELGGDLILHFKMIAAAINKMENSCSVQDLNKELAE